jgi:hypothetical protein
MHAFVPRLDPVACNKSGQSRQFPFLLISNHPRRLLYWTSACSLRSALSASPPPKSVQPLSASPLVSPIVNTHYPRQYQNTIYIGLRDLVDIENTLASPRLTSRPTETNPKRIPPKTTSQSPSQRSTRCRSSSQPAR